MCYWHGLSVSAFFLGDRKLYLLTQLIFSGTTAENSAPEAGCISSFSQFKLWEFSPGEDRVSKKAIWDDLPPVIEVPPLPKRPPVPDVDFSPSEVVELYKEWLKADVHLLFYRSERIPDDEFHYHEYSHELIGVKASKRGNDVYAYRLRKRLEWATISDFSRISVLTGSGREIRSNLLMITLTDDRSVSLREAWLSLSFDLNRYVSYLRRVFGSVLIFRSFEAHSDGYPHVHLLAYFPYHSFSCFEHTGKDGVSRIRVRGKARFEYYRGFVDVESVNNMSNALSYLLKYILKATSPDHKRTDKEWLFLALTWVFRKRIYGTSEDFEKSILDLIKYKCNSNNDVSVSNSLNEALEGVIWEFITVQALNLTPDDWRVKWIGESARWEKC